MLTWLIVAAGGGLGAVCRYLLSVSVNRQLPGAFPFGTLSVNIIGALLLGVLAGLLASGGLRPSTGDLLWVGLGIGFCGSFTTMSSWSLDSLRLGLDRRPALLVLNFLLTFIGCLVAVMIGYFGGARFAG